MRIALSFLGCHRRAGVERIILECADFLALQGHIVDVFSSEWEQDAPAPAVRRHHVPVTRSPAIARFFTSARRSRTAMKELIPAPDVHGSFGVLCPPGGVLWVQSVHRAWLDISRRARGLGGRIRQACNPVHPYLLAKERACFEGRQYRKLIALTDTVKNDLMRLYGVPKDDVVVLPNGFSSTEFNRDRASMLRTDMRRKLGYDDGQKVIIFVANELERKGFGPLLRAVASLNDRDVYLLAVGRLQPGPYEAEICRLGMEKRVQFVGPTANVAEYYAAADIFALPTTYEAWGMVIVEAMACGLPVLTSRLAGAAVAVSENLNGLLLDDPADVNEIADKLKRLLRRRHAPPEVISRSVSEYSWDRILPCYEQILTQCAAGAATPRSNAVLAV